MRPTTDRILTWLLLAVCTAALFLAGCTKPMPNILQPDPPPAAPASMSILLSPAGLCPQQLMDGFYNQTAPQAVEATVQVLDANGDPIPQQPVRFVSGSGVVETWTDGGGRASTVWRAPVAGPVTVTAGGVEQHATIAKTCPLPPGYPGDPTNPVGTRGPTTTTGSGSGS